MCIRDRPYTKPVGEVLTCELVSDVTGEKMACSVKQLTIRNQYEIGFQPTSPGRYHLHVKVEEEHIKESPFAVTVIRKLGTPIKIIGDLKGPWGVVIDQKGNVIVAENGKDSCVSIISPTGENIMSFGDSPSRMFNNFIGLAVDDDGNILVSNAKHREIQKFTSDGECINFSRSPQSGRLYGFAIHPLTKEVYVANRYDHLLEILNPELKFSSNFCSQGSENGQFQFPWDVAFDSSGNMYVADTWNRCIPVFNAKKEFIRRIGERELGFPSSICIDSSDVVYVTDDCMHCVSVFTCEGDLLTSFGGYGSEPGQFNLPRGVAVDKSGVVYVSDHKNNRLQLF